MTVIPGSIDTPFFEHAANFMGRKVKAMAPAAPADDVALAIERAIVHPKREVVIGASVRVAMAAKTIMPRFTERMIARSVMNGHFEQSEAQQSRGSVMRPNGKSRVSGGRKSERSMVQRKPAVVTAALTIGSAAALIGFLMSPH